MGIRQQWQMLSDIEITCVTCKEKPAVWGVFGNTYRVYTAYDGELKTSQYRHCFTCKVKLMALMANGEPYEDIRDYNIRDIMTLWLIKAMK